MTRSEEPDEIRTLAGLPRSIEPDPALEDRVVAALGARGLIARRGSKDRARWHVAAAVLLAALAGWIARGLVETRGSAATADGIYLLLLAEPRPLRTDKPLKALVEEYTAWASALADRKRLVAAAHLGDETRRLSSPAAGQVVQASNDDLDQVTGYFVVRASDLEDALELAATCPHVAYGGDISVREVR